MILLDLLNMGTVLLAQLLDGIFLVSVKFHNFLLVVLLKLCDQMLMLTCENIPSRFLRRVLHIGQRSIKRVFIELTWTST